MTIEIEGKDIPVTASGFLENIEDWSETIASRIAEQEGINMTDRHWDLIAYLRDEFLNNAGIQPNTRNMVKALSKNGEISRLMPNHFTICSQGTRANRRVK